MHPASGQNQPPRPECPARLAALRTTTSRCGDDGNRARASFRARKHHLTTHKAQVGSTRFPGSPHSGERGPPGRAREPRFPLHRPNTSVQLNLLARTAPPLQMRGGPYKRGLPARGRSMRARSSRSQETGDPNLSVVRNQETSFRRYAGAPAGERRPRSPRQYEPPPRRGPGCRIFGLHKTRIDGRCRL